MLGKRSRALQRTTSSSHIGMDSSSAQNRDKLRPPAITVPAPCQIIVGYYNTPKEMDGEKKHSPPLESMSPRSGLQCLLTDVVRKKELGETACKSVGLSIVIESRSCEGTGGSQPGLAPRSPGGFEAALASSSRQSKPQIVWKSMLPPQCRDSWGGSKRVPSPAGAVSPPPAVYGSVLPAPLPAIDFLDACYLCKRRLGPGRDIYMYRGDRAFCSVECRWKQILTDEHGEKCASAALKPVSAKPSRHANGHRTRVEGRGLATAA